MAHKIFGKITDQVSGQAVAGAYVEAWDSDTPGADDLMGYTETDSDGNYVIDYSNKKWDTKIPGLTTFRPDIYLEIYRPNVCGLFIKAKTTSVKSNWKMADDLEWNTSTPNRDYASTVRGTVRWADTGLPAAGLQVIAYEVDKSDPEFPVSLGFVMGYGMTDVNGWYVVEYWNEGWDSDEDSLFDSTSWRPDIKVVVKQRVGVNWTWIGDSGVYHDVKFVEGLMVDLAVSKAVTYEQHRQD